MSTEKDQGLRDYSNYQGKYQAGEVIGQDGETIDLDELEQPVDTGIPIVVKLMFLLLFAGLTGIAYYVVTIKPKKPPKQRIAAVKVDKVYEDALDVTNKIRDKQFKAFFTCWTKVLRHESKPALNAASLTKACPTQTILGSAYKAACAGENCKDIQLQRCSNGQCTAEAGLSYLDFLYMLMQQYADRYNRVAAYQALYTNAKSTLKDMELERSKKDEPSEKEKQTKAQVEAYRAKLKTVLTEPFTTGQAITEAVARAKKLNAANVKAEEPKKKKRRRRRRRRRRRAKAKAEVPTIQGGTIYGDRRFPIEAFRVNAYRPIDSRYYPLEDRADEVGEKGSLRHNGSSVNYWADLSMQNPMLHICAYRFTKKDQPNPTVKIKIGIDSKGGSPIAGTAEVDTGTPANEPLKQCILKALTRLRLRGIPSTQERLNLAFTVVLRK